MRREGRSWQPARCRFTGTSGCAAGLSLSLRKHPARLGPPLSPGSSGASPQAAARGRGRAPRRRAWALPSARRPPGRAGPGCLRPAAPSGAPWLPVATGPGGGGGAGPPPSCPAAAPLPGPAARWGTHALRRAAPSRRGDVIAARRLAARPPAALRGPGPPPRRQTHAHPAAAARACAVRAGEGIARTWLPAPGCPQPVRERRGAAVPPAPPGGPGGGHKLAGTNK